MDVTTREVVQTLTALYQAEVANGATPEQAAATVDRVMYAVANKEDKDERETTRRA